MQRITLHIPETRNDGSPVSEEIYALYEEEVFELALAAKIATGCGEIGFNLTRNVTGYWRSPTGDEYREAIRLYWLDVTDASPVIDRLVNLAERVKADLDQEAVYVTVADVMAVTVMSGLPV